MDLKLPNKSTDNENDVSCNARLNFATLFCTGRSVSAASKLEIFNEETTFNQSNLIFNQMSLRDKKKNYSLM